ncbi:unnamed protein product [marine sediment metagenome]|uniref:Uncharacterized protein n=1 Tax=marine sediment metagenome TaxID=412755 RepID=X0UL59_9ZZZZ
MKKLEDSPIVFHSSMKVNEAAEIACSQPTLEEALAWMAVWESERVIKFVKANPGKQWDTCFRRCFEEVLSRFRK